jgi:hypothetical protein
MSVKTGLKHFLIGSPHALAKYVRLNVTLKKANYDAATDLRKKI